jgi:hypothetical protein
MLNIATLHNEQGEVERSLEWVDKAAAVQPSNPEVLWRKGLLELAQGDYARGWMHYEAGLGHPGMRGANPGFAGPAWDGAPCRRLLVWHEQGLGDTIQFVRYGQLCRQRAETVIVLCPAELVALLRSCPFVDAVTDKVRPGDFDQHVSIMSLPHRFGTTLDTIPAPIPYLFADAALARRWAGCVRGSGLRVGVAWSGRLRNDQPRFRVIDRDRRLPVAALEALLDVPNVAFHSLQMGEAAHEARGRGLVDPMARVRDFADTAAIIANLDLVISVDTSVAHLAGAMGKPVWVLSRLDACWRWLRNRPASPWYPTARVFGQTEQRSWTAVIDAVKRELVALSR